MAKEGVYTVERLVEDYIAEYVTHHRIPANAKALASRLRRGIAQIASLEPSCVTRSVAFDLVQRLADTPMAAASVKQELGAAWEFAYDRGRDEDVPTWCADHKGRLTRGFAVRHKGTDKRGTKEINTRTLAVTAIQDVTSSDSGDREAITQITHRNACHFAQERD